MTGGADRAHAVPVFWRSWKPHGLPTLDWCHTFCHIPPLPHPASESPLADVDMRLPTQDRWIVGAARLT